MMFAFAGLFAGDVVVAQAAPASVQAAPPAVSDVVVQADRLAAVERIDRNIYDLKSDPQAQTAPLVDVLGRLPSVSVTPTGELRLLGVGGVTVLIDGKPAANAAQKLSTLRGGDVDKVEVMTNPSAQFGPQGTAGIINIVTRRHYRDGWSGSATAKTGSDGDVGVNLSPSLALGKWTLSGAVDLNRNRSRSEGLIRYDLLDDDGALAETRLEESLSKGVQTRRSAEIKLAYQPDEKRRLFVSAEASDWGGPSRSETAHTSTGEAYEAYVEQALDSGALSTHAFGAGYEWTGTQAGESLKLDASFDHMHWPIPRTVIDVYADREEAFSSLTVYDKDDTTLKADYERPLAAKVLLTSGGAWTRTDQDEANRLEILSGDPIPGGGYDRRLTARTDTLAAYATVQFPAAGWTVLPGLRFEDWQARGQGGAIDRRDQDWFPSLHVSRTLPRNVSLRLSYSRRIQRVEASVLDPTIYYYASTNAWRGNPDLKPTITQAYEVRLSGKLRGQSLELTLYDRVSTDVTTNFTSLTADGVNLRTTVNAGGREQAGGQVALRGPLPGRLKYSLSANLYVRRTQVLEDGVLRDHDQASASGNAQLDYKFAAPPDREAQQLQGSLQYYGPSRSLQTREKGFVRADLTWRRPLTVRVSSVVKAQIPLRRNGFEQSVTGDGFRQLTLSRDPGLRVEWSLVYRLGGKS